MEAAQRAALDGDDDHLEAVLKESLRLHPIIPMVVRFLTRPATVGGHALPAGVSVGPSILLAHADSENFPQPEEFRPSRFLDEEVRPNTWIPFGGGMTPFTNIRFSALMRAMCDQNDGTFVGLTNVKTCGAYVEIFGQRQCVSRDR